MTKTILIESFQNLPENLSVDQVIDHIIFVEKVQKGLRDSENENVFSTSEAKSKLSKWLK